MGNFGRRATRPSFSGKAPSEFSRQHPPNLLNQLKAIAIGPAGFHTRYPIRSEPPARARRALTAAQVQGEIPMTQKTIYGLALAGFAALTTGAALADDQALIDTLVHKKTPKK